MTKFTFPFRNGLFDIRNYKYANAKNKISKYELMCMMQEIYRTVSYFRDSDYLQKVFDDNKLGTYISFVTVYCFIVYMILIIIGEFPFWVVYMIGFMIGWVAIWATARGQILIGLYLGVIIDEKTSRKRI